MVRRTPSGEADTTNTAEVKQQQTEPRRSFFARMRHYHPDPPSIDGSEPTPPYTPVLNLDDQSFLDALTDCVTVVDFWAPWCKPCKAFQPRFDDIARSNADKPLLQFVRVNVDENPGVAAALNVMSIPTLVVFDQTGNVIDREIGVPGKRRLTQLTRDANAAADTLIKLETRGTRGTQ